MKRARQPTGLRTSAPRTCVPSRCLRRHSKSANSCGKRHLRRSVLGASDTRRLRRRVRSARVSSFLILHFSFFNLRPATSFSKNPLASRWNDIKPLKISLNIYVAHAAVKAFLQIPFFFFPFLISFVALIIYGT